MIVDLYGNIHMNAIVNHNKERRIFDLHTYLSFLNHKNCGKKSLFPLASSNKVSQ
jgi:hypothetical protein